MRGNLRKLKEMYPEMAARVCQQSADQPLGVPQHCPDYHIWSSVSWSLACTNVVQVLLKRAKEGPLV